MLKYGYCCRENCITVKVYRMGNIQIPKRVEYCINKGCGYKKELPFTKKEK